MRPILNNASELQEIQETGSKQSSTNNNDPDEKAIYRVMKKGSIEITGRDSETMDANYGPPVASIVQEYPEVGTPYKIVASNTIFNEPSAVDFGPKSDHLDTVNRAHLRPHTPIQRMF